MRDITTPGFVLNGKECPDWSGLTEVLKTPGAPAGTLKVSSVDLDHWQVWFTPLALGRENYEVHAALLASGLASDVKAGENQGRHLTHDFVVTALTKTPLKTYQDAAWGQFVLNKTGKGQTGRLALAVWVTHPGRMEPLQAVGGWLRSQSPAQSQGSPYRVVTPSIAEEIRPAPGAFSIPLTFPWLAGGFRVALGSHWGGFKVALGSQSVGYQQAFGWL